MGAVYTSVEKLKQYCRMHVAITKIVKIILNSWCGLALHMEEDKMLEEIMKGLYLFKPVLD